MADGASLYAFISISIRTHFVFQAEIKITEAVPGRGSTRCKPCHSASWESSWKINHTRGPCLYLLGASCKLWRWWWWGSKQLAFLLPLSPRYVWGVTSSAITTANHPCCDVQEGAFHVCAGHREKSTKERRWCPGPESLCAALCYGSAALIFHQAAAAVLVLTTPHRNPALSTVACEHPPVQGAPSQALPITPQWLSTALVIDGFAQ